MADTEVHSKHIKRLLELDAVKVWSLIATLMGDELRKGKHELSGVEIRYRLGRLGYKPEAVRVALHRLRKEGWIETEKNGRETKYRLSDYAKSETRAASADVYRDTIKYVAGWSIVHFSSMPETLMKGFLPLDKNACLAPIELAGRYKDTLASIIEAGAVPDWLHYKVLSANSLKIAEGLVAVLEDLEKNPETIPFDERDDINLLTLHFWRKLALRESTWFHCWSRPNGILAKCHAAITSRM